MPDFKWSRFDDPEAKTGGIELISNTPVKEIYGWVGDTRNDFRRDFRLVGLVDNDIGYSEMPDYPDLPPGYPDKAPAGIDTSKYRIKDIEPEVRPRLDINCEFIDSEFCAFRRNESSFLDIPLEKIFMQKQFNPSWQVPMMPKFEVQIQPNLWRKVMATQVASNRWRLEVRLYVIMAHRI